MYEAHDLPLLRMLTDRGTEYCGKVEQHDYELFLAVNDIEHTKTKVHHPQTNGISATAPALLYLVHPCTRERFHKTILQEFYQITFRLGAGAHAPRAHAPQLNALFA